jgi:DNA-binding transcriptional LysR family regulator
VAQRLAQRLDIDSLRALCAIEDHGGITRAAAFLGLSQSAVSHKIKRLEKSLECDVLCRRPGAPVFTDAGNDLLAYAKRILSMHDEALLSLSKTPLHGKISLGMTEDIACSDLSRVLGRFARLHPGVSVRAQVHQSLALQRMLAKGSLDLAILQVFEHEVRPSDKVLYRERLHWVKSPFLEIDPGKRVPFLSFSDDCFYRRWALDTGQGSGPLFETVLECTSAAGVIAGVCSGLGVALLSDRHLRSDMEILSNPFPGPPAIAYVIRIARKVPNNAVDALAKEIGRDVDRQGMLRVA